MLADSFVQVLTDSGALEFRQREQVGFDTVPLREFLLEMFDSAGELL
jgi:hypothetical protein